MKKILYILFFATLALLAGCVDDYPSPEPPDTVNRVLFIYLAIDDYSISSAGKANIDEMVAGATKTNMNGGQIVVFCDTYGSNPQLIRIYAGADGLGHRETLIEYTEDMDSSKPATLKRAFEDMKKHVTGQSYALAFGSHGTGWMPSSMHSKYCSTWGGLRMMMSQYSDSGVERIIPQFETRALFSDVPASSWMEFSDFAATVASLQTDKFDYIMFDLCYMGGVEVAYALRNATDRIVFSPAEVLMRGMPYHKVMPHLFANVPRLGDNGLCKENIDFFKTYTVGSNTYDYATMSYIDCTKFDRFAAVMRQIIGNNAASIYGRTSTADLPHYDRNSIHTMFDIREFVKSLGPDAVLLAEFESALGELVQSKQTTGRMFTLQFDLNRYSGLTTYVPMVGQDEPLENYRRTEWFLEVYPE